MAREMDHRQKQLWALIWELVRVLMEAGGELHYKEAHQRVARKTGLSMAEMPYVVTSAQAERLVTFSLRTGMVGLTEEACERA